MKMQRNSLPNAKAVLKELTAVTHEVEQVAYWLTPFGKHDKAVAKTFPEYLGKTRAHLQAAKLGNFKIEYPAISEMMENGQTSDDGMKRFFDGIYKLGTLRQELVKRKFLVKTEADCLELQGIANRVVGDLAVYTITQFGLASSTGVQLDVGEYCNEIGITADILYGQWLTAMENAGEAPYGYETISPYYETLQEIDPVLMSECEEAGFPLTADICEKLIHDDISAEEVRGQIVSFIAATKEVVVEGVTPGNMLQKMALT